MSRLPRELENLILDYTPSAHLRQSTLPEQIRAVYRLTGVRLPAEIYFEVVRFILLYIKDGNWEDLYFLNQEYGLGLADYLRPHYWEIFLQKLLPNYYRYDSLRFLTSRLWCKRCDRSKVGCSLLLTA